VYKELNQVYTFHMPEQLSRIELKLAELEGKIDATYKSAEKMRKYMMWTAIITVAVIVIPLLILPFVIPAFLSSVTLPAGY
jgi:hypothetical protein